MNPLLRSILAVLLGAVLAFVLVACVEAIGHVVYPLPADLDLSDSDSVNAAITAMPVGAFLFVLLAWVVGTFGGAVLASWLAGRAPIVHGLVIGGLLLAAGVANMLMLPHPGWFCVVAVLLVPSAAYVGAALGGNWSRRVVR
jgi:hypothetical protein